LIIIVAEKSLHPAITPLGDVVRYSRYDDSCYPCHAWIITGIVPNCQVLSILSPESSPESLPGIVVPGIVAESLRNRFPGIPP